MEATIGCINDLLRCSSTERGVTSLYIMNNRFVYPEVDIWNQKELRIGSGEDLTVINSIVIAVIAIDL